MIDTFLMKLVDTIGALAMGGALLFGSLALYAGVRGYENATVDIMRVAGVVSFALVLVTGYVDCCLRNHQLRGLRYDVDED
jgi:ABC-type methionine transport system permease subunit